MPSHAPEQKPTQSTHTSVGAGRKPAPPPTLGTVGHKYQPSHNFCYMAHPLKFDVYPVGEDENGKPKYEILPYLEVLEYKPGVNGVRHIKGHDDGDPTMAIAAMERQGYRRVPTDWIVEAFGEQVEGYVHVFDGAFGDIHLPVWNRLYQVGDAGDSHIVRDIAGYIEFQRRVLKEILGGRIDDQALVGLKSRLDYLEKAGRAGNASPSARVASEECRAKLTVVTNPASGVATSAGRKAKPAPKAPE
jgi:hypothetical protein